VKKKMKRAEGGGGETGLSKKNTKKKCVLLEKNPDMLEKRGSLNFRGKKEPTFSVPKRSFGMGKTSPLKQKRN